MIQKHMKHEDDTKTHKQPFHFNHASAFARGTQDGDVKSVGWSAQRMNHFHFEHSMSFPHLHQVK